MAANWADTYILNRIDHFFDVNSMQSQFVKKAVNEDIMVIKMEIFPRVATEFEGVQKSIESNTPISLDQFVRREEILKKIFFDSIKIFEPNAQQFVKKLSASQLEVFQKVFDKKMGELREDLENPATAKKKRFERIKTQMQSWIGTLTNDQLLEIQAFSNDNLYPLKESIKNREKISREFIASFQNEVTKRKFINRLFTDYESMRDPDFVKASETDQQKLYGLIVNLLNKMTAEQRKHLVETLKDRIEQLRKSTEKNKSRLG